MSGGHFQWSIKKNIRDYVRDLHVHLRVRHDRSQGAPMWKPQIGGLGLLIALVAVLSTEMVLARLIDTSIDNVPWPDQTSAIVHDRSAACGTTTRPEFQQDGNEPRGQVDGVMVAEDMRCRQCHGKCSADSLRCRSQCASDSPCLVHCEERTRNCESMCKQIFQCQ